MSDRYFSKTSVELGQKITRIWLSEAHSKSGASGYVSIWHDSGQISINFAMGTMPKNMALEMAEIIKYATELEPKTIEQLRDERDAAADALANYSCGVYPKDQNLYLDRYKEARAAHLAAVKGGL